MTKPFTILLDCDGPLANFTEAYVNALNDMEGTDHKASDASEWYILSSLGYSGEEAIRLAKKMAERVCEPGFCHNIKPQPWAKEMFDELSDIGEIIIVTSPFPGSMRWMGERVKWLEYYFRVSHKDIIFASRKDMVTGDCLIDDKMSHVHDWAENFLGRESILFPLKTNAGEEIPPHRIPGPSRVNRATDWRDVVRLVSDMEREMYGRPAKRAK
jgi:5'(3')-deoxyribonucleotidase